MGDHNIIYGFNLIVKFYVLFPKCLSLPVVIQHGWYDYISEWDLNSDRLLMLVFSMRNKLEWIGKSRKPVIIIGAPF